MNDASKQNSQLPQHDDDEEMFPTLGNAYTHPQNEIHLPFLSASNDQFSISRTTAQGRGMFSGDDLTKMLIFFIYYSRISATDAFTNKI